MDIYFCGSIRGGRDDAEIYEDIVGTLQEHGGVLSEHVGDAGMDADGEDDLSERYIHDRDLDWVAQADAVVAEVTQPSLGVGYEVAKAGEWDKPLLCLYRPDGEKDLSAMVRGSPDATVYEYDAVDELDAVLDAFLADVDA